MATTIVWKPASACCWATTATESRAQASQMRFPNQPTLNLVNMPSRMGVAREPKEKVGVMGSKRQNPTSAADAVRRGLSAPQRLRCREQFPRWGRVTSSSHGLDARTIMNSFDTVREFRSWALADFSLARSSAGVLIKAGRLWVIPHTSYKL